MAEALALTDFLTLRGKAPADDSAAAAVPGASPEPVFGTTDADAAELSGLRYQAPTGYQVRELRGNRMRTVRALFDEFAAALQFPYYFGQNRDAFDECLHDLDDSLGDAPGYVVVIREADQLLADDDSDRGWLEAALAEAATFWADRGVAFRVVLQGTVADVPAVPIRL